MNYEYKISIKNLGISIENYRYIKVHLSNTQTQTHTFISSSQIWFGHTTKIFFLFINFRQIDRSKKMKVIFGIDWSQNQNQLIDGNSSMIFELLKKIKIKDVIVFLKTSNDDYRFFFLSVSWCEKTKREKKTELIIWWWMNGWMIRLWWWWWWLIKIDDAKFAMHFSSSSSNVYVWWYIQQTLYSQTNI